MKVLLIKIFSGELDSLKNQARKKNIEKEVLFWDLKIEADETAAENTKEKRKEKTKQGSNL